MGEIGAYTVLVIALLILIPLFLAAGLLAGAVLAVYLEVAR